MPFSRRSWAPMSKSGVNGALVLGTSLLLTLRVVRRTLQQPVIGDVKTSRRAEVPLLEKDLREVRG